MKRQQIYSETGHVNQNSPLTGWAKDFISRLERQKVKSHTHGHVPSCSRKMRREFQALVRAHNHHFPEVSHEEVVGYLFRAVISGLVDGQPIFQITNLSKDSLSGQQGNMI